MSFIKSTINHLFRRHSIPILCSCVVFLMTLLAFFQLKEYVHFRHEKLFGIRSEHTKEIIQNRIRDYAKILNGAKAFYEASDTLTREKWRSYVQELMLDKDFPKTLSLRFVSYLTASEKSGHVRQIALEDPTFSVYPKGSRETYAIIDYIEPANARNNTLLGYDLFTDPVRKKALDNARLTRQFSMSSKLKFVNDESKEPFTGFLLAVPLFKKGISSEGAEIINSFKGYIVCPLRVHYLTDVIRAKDFQEMDVEVYEGEYMMPESMIIDTNNHNDLLDSDTKSMHRLLQLNLGGRHWNLYFSSLPNFGTSNDSNLPIIVLFGGFIIGILLFFVIFAYSSRQLESLALARKMTKSLRESEAQITNIFNNSPDAVIVINKDSEILKWNPKAEKLFGWKEEEVIGTNLTNTIVPKQHREAHMRGMAHFLATGHGPVINTTVEVTALNKDQQEFDIELSISNTSENGSPIFIAFINDITERKKSQHIIGQKTKELENSNAELQQFASIASHDLKEPLRKILLFADLLVKEYKENLPEEGQAYIDRMHNAASRMQELIEDLLAFSRIGSKQEYFENVDLNVVIYGILTDLEISIQQKNAKIEYDDLPSLNAIPNQMRQLFQNLISNALKFCKQDVQPHIHITYKIINGTQLKGAATKSVNQSYCEIKVSDNGIGFEAVYAEKIFVIFQRLHGREAYDGTGIGLAICKKIAEYHNGYIYAESTPGKGSVFTITLPIVT
jgi:two-component system sensor kinase FixL